MQAGLPGQAPLFLRWHSPSPSFAADSNANAASSVARWPRTFGDYPIFPLPLPIFLDAQGFFFSRQQRATATQGGRDGLRPIEPIGCVGSLLIRLVLGTSAIVGSLQSATLRVGLQPPIAARARPSSPPDVRGLHGARHVPELGMGHAAA